MSLGLAGLLDSIDAVGIYTILNSLALLFVLKPMLKFRLSGRSSRFFFSFFSESQFLGDLVVIW